MVRRRSGPQSVDTDFASALEAMSAPELRAAVRTVLEELDEGVKASVVDTLIARATKATPSQRIVEEARSFAEAARHIGHADPDDVTEHLRRATKAFLAGDHSSARAVFEAILPPIASVDIDLGQHEPGIGSRQLTESRLGEVEDRLRFGAAAGPRRRLR